MGFVQQNGGVVTSGSTVVVTFPSNVTAGNNLIVVLAMAVGFNNGATATATDSQGNSYGTIFGQPSGDAVIFTFIAKAKTTGSCTVTVHFTLLASPPAFLFAANVGILEWTSVLALAANSSLTYSASGSVTLGHVTTLGGGLLLAIGFSGSNSGTYTLTPPDFTNRVTVSSAGNTTLWVGDWLVSGAGTYGGETFSGIGGQNSGVIVTISPPISISCAGPPSGVVGSPYSHLFPVNGGVAPYTFAITVGSLPPGIVLDATTGSVSGTPITSGTFSFTVSVVDSASNIASVACSITISGSSPWVIQEITAEFIPSSPYIAGYGHFRYTVRCVNQAQAGTYLGFWASFGGSSNEIGGNTTASGTPAAPGAPPAGNEAVAVNATLIGTEPEINYNDGRLVAFSGSDDPTDGRVNVAAASTADLVNVQTVSYTVLSGDDGKLVTFDSVTAITATLPASPPAAPWKVGIQNQGTATLTVNPNSNPIDLGSSSIALAAGQGMYVYSNGTQYYTERGNASGVSGGVNVQPGTYTIVAASDAGKLVVINSASAASAILPLVAPPAPWFVAIENIGAGTVTVDRNGNTIDGAASNVSVLTNQGLFIFSDGTGYYTERGLAPPATVVGGVNARTSSYTAVSGDNSKLVSFNSGSSVTLTLPSSPPSTTWFVATENVGAGALTVSPNGLNLDGSASSLTVNQNQGVIIYTDGTNYFTMRGIGSTLTSPLTTKGDVWGYGSGNARIPIGTDTYVLTADSTQTLGLKWAPSSLSVTTKGDLQGFTSTPARMPVGTDGTVLTADSSQSTGLSYKARPYVIAVFMPGTYTASQVLYKFVYDRAVTYPANLSGAQGDNVANPTSGVSVSIVIGSTTITCSISTGGAVSFSGSGVTTSIGTIMTITAPVSPDATFAGLFLTMPGTW